MPSPGTACRAAYFAASSPSDRSRAAAAPRAGARRRRRHRGLPQIEPAKLGEGGQARQPGVADAGCVEVQVFEMGQRRELRQARVGRSVRLTFSRVRFGSRAIAANAASVIAVPLNVEPEDVRAPRARGWPPGRRPGRAAPRGRHLQERRSVGDRRNCDAALADGRDEPRRRAASRVTAGMVGPPRAIGPSEASSAGMSRVGSRDRQASRRRTRRHRSTSGAGRLGWRQRSLAARRHHVRVTGRQPDAPHELARAARPGARPGPGRRPCGCRRACRGAARPAASAAPVARHAVLAAAPVAPGRVDQRVGCPGRRRPRRGASTSRSVRSGAGAYSVR